MGPSGSRSGDFALFRQDLTDGTDDFGQLRDGLILKQLHRCQTEAALFRLGNDLDGENRIAAQFKKIVVNADAAGLEQLLPYLGQALFDGIARRLVRAAGVEARRRQRRGCFAIHLAVGGQRQRLVEQHERRGHHVVGQLFAHEFAQFRHGQLAARLRRNVGDQLRRVASPLAAPPARRDGPAVLPAPPVFSATIVQSRFENPSSTHPRIYGVPPSGLSHGKNALHIFVRIKKLVRATNRNANAFPSLFLVKIQPVSHIVILETACQDQNRMKITLFWGVSHI